MKGVKYVGPVLDFSGYGEAARNYVFSLHSRGIPVTVFPRNFDPNPPPIANEEQRRTLDLLIGREIPYDIVIIHLTPDLYPRYAEKGKYNIGYVAWETSLLHPTWVRSIGATNEMWVPCDWNIEALHNSGIKIPVYKIPHGIDTNMFSGAEDKKFVIKNLDSSTFKFYSIFQWMYRKNPEGLLRAYFNAFDDKDNVALILKTYRMGVNRDKEFIRNKILDIKKDMNIGYYPKVILVCDLLSKSQMLGLHTYGDSCVCLHRGEGWGLPLFEAGLAGNPVVATGLGGNLEFMKEDNSYLVDYQDTYVMNMSFFNQWYLSNQTWAEPNLIHASQLMREIYDNRDEALEKGRRLNKYIVDNFSWSSIADIIVGRLQSI